MPSEEDYKIAICNPPLIKCPLLAGGKVYPNNKTPYMWAGGFCVVFKYAKADGQDCAVRCWKADVDDSKRRTQMIAEGLKKLNLPYFVNFEYHNEAIVANGVKHPVVIMDWADGKVLKKYIEANLHNPAALETLSGNFKTMAADLHANNLSHGDLQHGNIMVKNDGSLILIDYDSMYVPGMESFSDSIKGQIGYQHPARVKVKNLTPKADYFSELIIYTGLLWIQKDPCVFSKLKISDTEHFILSVEDILNPGNSKTLNELCSNADKELAYLGAAIRQELSKDSIDELRPLEEILDGMASFKVQKAELPGISELLQSFSKKVSSFKWSQVNVRSLFTPKRIAAVAGVACFIALAIWLFSGHSSDSGIDVNYKNMIGVNDPRLPGIYSFVNSKGEMFTAEVKESEMENTLKLVIYSAYKPMSLNISFDENSKIYSEKLGVGAAVVDPKSKTLVIAFENGAESFSLTKYL